MPTPRRRGDGRDGWIGKPLLVGTFAGTRTATTHLGTTKKLSAPACATWTAFSFFRHRVPHHQRADLRHPGNDPIRVRIVASTNKLVKIGGVKLPFVTGAHSPDDALLYTFSTTVDRKRGTAESSISSS